MRPLTLKEPAKCCGTGTLLWSPQKGEYNCPCGQMRTDMNGRLIKVRVSKQGNPQRISRSFSR